MGGSSSQTIGQRYFAKLTTFIGNPIEKLIGINFDNRGWIFKPDNDESFLRVESPNLYGDKEGGVAGFIDIHTGTADQLPNTTYSADFPKVSGYPFQSYLLFRGLGKKSATNGGIGQFTQGSSKHYNGSFYHGNSGYMKEMLLWPQRVHVRNDGRPQWYDEKAEINKTQYIDFVADAVSNSVPESTIYKMISTYGYKDNFGEDVSTTNNFNGSVSNNLVSVKFNLPYSNVVSGTNGLSEVYETNTFELQIPLIYVYVEIESTVLVKCENYEFKGVGSDWIYVDLHKGEVRDDGYTYYTIRALYKNKTGHMSYQSDRYGSVNNDFGFIGMIQATPVQGGFLARYGESGDINPIHKIREIFTDDTAMNKPETEVNNINFVKAADALYEEALGISWSVTEKSCLEAINEICGHIEAGVRVNRQTGLYEMVLFRDDWFDEDEIHTLPVNKIKSMQLDGATSVDELINKLNVSYYNREAIKDSSFSIAENASIRNLNGHENPDDVKFPYFMNQRNAAVVGQWKLKQMSTPVWQGTFTTGFYEARKWNRYDLLKLPWPRKWSGTILVRIMKINLGTGTDVSIDFVEVVPYSSDLSSSIVIDTPVDTTPKPPQPALFKVFELSYLEAVQLNGQKAVDDALAYNPVGGYVACIAKRPQSNSLSALMYTNVGNDYERVGTITYCETAELAQNITKVDSVFRLKNAGEIDMVNTGTQIIVNTETMVYQSYDEETGLITVKRGALDTIPQVHIAGSVMYFADDFITVDPTEYVPSEVVDVKALTTTPSGVLDIAEVDAQQVEIQARAVRPYPPANVKINGEYYPSEVSGTIELTWNDRNRHQQTGGAILGWYEGGVLLEPNVSYVVELYDSDDFLISRTNVVGVNTAVIDISTLNSITCKIILFSQRDGYDSYQKFQHIAVVGFEPPYNLVGTYDAPNNSVDLAWSFDE